MDFLDPKKKKAQRIRLIIGYVLIGIAVALVTLILVFQTYGYDLDRKTGAIIQNGLVYVAAQPEPANVYLNGKQYKNQANARLVLPSDVYKLELTRDGYRSWSRSFSLAGGTIERFDYPFLFPADLKINDQKTYTAPPAFASQSLDRRWILILQPGQTGAFDVFDANDPKKAPTTISVPTNVLTAGAQSQLSLVEWSTDNRHLLVRHDYAGGSEFVLIDREVPTESFNVNQTFSTKPIKATLRDKKYDQFYLLDGANRQLSTAELSSKTLQPVQTGVLEYATHGTDLIMYATDQGATAGKTRIMYREGQASYLLREVSASPVYLMDLAQYNNQWYLVAGSQADNRAYIYKNPQGQIKSPDPQDPLFPQAVLRVDAPNWLDFSANTQFIALQGGSQFGVYDFEHDRTYRYDLKLPLDAATPHASWMDGHRLILNSQGKMVVVDYDGTNLQTLAANQPGLLPFFDRDYKRLYNIAARPNGAALGRINLKISETN